MQVALTELTVITAESHAVEIELVYSTSNNIAGRPVYAQARCALRPQAADCLLRASTAARRAGYTLKVLDAYRPAAAQEVFWTLVADPQYVSDPALGSAHTRGVAVDVTLIGQDGAALDMGTSFDAMDDRSHHDRDDLPVSVQRNRSMLLGIMLQAGFQSIASEWWHYELPQAHHYPLLDDPIVSVHPQI